MGGARRLGNGPKAPVWRRCAHGIHPGAGCCLLWLGCMPVLAAPPPRLGIKPHTVNPRYAYAVSGRSLRVQRDCRRHRGLLHLDVQVINRGTSRIDMPVQLRVRWPAFGHAPVIMDVPVLAPGRSIWMRVDLPFAIAPAPSRLRLALTAGGQAWNRLQLPAPSAVAPCPGTPPSAAAHTRETVR